MKAKAAVCDTNIVIDHIMGRSKILSRLLQNNTPVHIPLPVWLESVFVLALVFHQTPNTISNTLSQLLSTKGIKAPNITVSSILLLYTQNPSPASLIAILSTLPTPTNSPSPPETKSSSPKSTAIHNPFTPTNTHLTLKGHDPIDW